MDEKFGSREGAFRAGMHLWSNPKLRGTPAEIPIILARPTILDVIALARRYPLDVLHAANRRLRALREISERQYLRTGQILRHIACARIAGDLSDEDLVAAAGIAADTPPDRMEETLTVEQHQRTLAAWLPAGLPTIEVGRARLIRLADVPRELEIALKRWLRWRLDSEPDKVSMWLMDTPQGQALTHTGWCAFLSWLTDALLCRLDQIEIGM